MQLFDDINRDDTGPAKQTEPPFQYLNRSARPEFQKIRDVMEEWFSHYPSDKQAEFRQEFRNEENHQAAFFELFAHELLLKLNCTILQLHPPTNQSTTPDFQVKDASGTEFFIEATIRKDGRTNPHVDSLCEIVDSLESPDFFICLQIIKPPVTTPSKRKLQAFLKSKLEEIDWTEIAALQAKDVDNLPIWEYEEGEMKVQFSPLVKSNDLRGKSGSQTLGIVNEGAFWVNHGEALKKKLRSKATKYGQLEVPYIIAVNGLDFFPEDEPSIDIINALLGTEQFIMQMPLGDSPKIAMTRKPDGLWTGSPDKPTNTRVSGVLFLPGLFPWSVPRSKIRLYHNPWAKYPAKSCLTELPQAIIKDNHVEFHDGKSLYEIFDLPSTWPRD